MFKKKQRKAKKTKRNNNNKKAWTIYSEISDSVCISEIRKNFFFTRNKKENEIKRKQTNRLC